MLIGLGAIWVGVYLEYVDRRDPSGQHISPIEARLWLTAWLIGGTGFFCIGLTALRHTRDHLIAVPASAPLVDQVIWYVGIACAPGFFALMLCWMAVGASREKRARQEGSNED
jgi:hypothetical protein